MSLSMYQASVPVFERMFGNLSAILTKAEAYSESKKIDPSVLVTGSRLAPDMFPLMKQIQIATDIAKFCIARLSGETAPSFEDNETSFADLQERLKKALTFIKSVDAKKIDGTEGKDVTIKTGGKEITLKGDAYLLHFVLPNVYFHITTAYLILRHNGLDIGKMDYIGKPV